MDNKKITELPLEALPSNDDVLAIVSDPIGTPQTRQVTVSNLLALTPDNSTPVTLATVASNYLSLSGQQLTAGTVPVSLGGTGATTAATARTSLGVDASGTDNSTPVTLATVASNYLSLSGQQLTAGTVPVSLGGTGATTAAAARTNLGISGASLSFETEAGATRTLSDSDSGKVISCTNTSDVTITIPSTLTSGFNCRIVQSGTGQVAVTAGSGVNLYGYAGLATAGRYAAINIVPVSSSTYVIEGEATFPPGDFDNNIYAVRLDGATEYLATGSTFNSLFQDSFSMSFWARVDASSTGLRFLATSAISGVNRFQVNFSGSAMSAYISCNSAQDTLTASTSHTYTDWFHVAVVAEQSGSNLNFKLYVNASNDDSGVLATNLSNFTTSTNLLLGARTTAGNSGSYGWLGDIDEVAFFNTALSGPQVANIYKGQNNGATTGGTNGVPGDLTTFSPAHWWRMGDSDSASSGGIVTTITDLRGSVDLSGQNTPVYHDLSTDPDSIHVA
jgi:hypothetical protein